MSAQRKAPLRMRKRVLRKIKRRLVAGDHGKQIVLKLSWDFREKRFVVAFFCAILRPLSLGYLVSYFRK